MTRISSTILLGAFALSIPACTPTPEQHAHQTMPTTNDAPKSTSTGTATEIAADSPLQSGLVAFQGMIRPTKGGYEVRGVILEDDALPRALGRANSTGAHDSDGFLGALVRVVGEVKRHDPAPPSGDDVMMQMRSGPWFELVRIDSATIVKPAETIEGVLERSKGFFTVASRLVTRDDIAWSLGPSGAKEGERVRLFGQSRTVVCEPNAQCLIEGSLPLFDVGRAERLP